MINIEPQLAQLESAQLVRRLTDPSTDSGDLAYLFKHALVQDTAHKSLLKHDRKRLHREVAETLERAYPERSDEYAAVLAQHYAYAEDNAKTLEYATRAGDVAARVYANEEAIAHYSQALDAARRITAPSPVVQELYLKRGRAFELLSHFDDAARNYEEMEATAFDRGDRTLELQALIARGTVYAIPGSMQDPPRAQTVLEHALGLARELGDRAAEAKVLWSLLLHEMYGLGNTERAVSYGEQSIAIARENNLREQLAYSLHDVSAAYFIGGNHTRAEAAADEAAGLLRGLDNKPMEAENFANLAVLSFARTDFPHALERARRAAQISESIGNLGGQAFSGHVLQYIYLELGEWGRAWSCLDAALRDIVQGGVVGPGMNPFSERAWVLANLGARERALERARFGVEHAQARVGISRVFPRAVLARIEAMNGNLAAASVALEGDDLGAPDDYFGKLFPLSEPFLLLTTGEIALARREFDHAAQIADTLWQRLEQIQMHAFQPDALYLQAQVRRAQGDIDGAYVALTQAAEQAVAMNGRRMLWQIYAALAEIETTRGNLNDATGWRDRAHTIIAFIADHAGDGEMRASFLNLPAVLQVTHDPR